VLNKRESLSIAIPFCHTRLDRADSTWQVDAVGVRNYGSTMPECEHSVAALALYAFVALVRMATFRWESPFRRNNEQ
jgi:hypothetical protein